MNQTPADVTREIVVTAPAELAFDVFTAQIGQWWPLAEFGLYGPHASVGFRGDRLVESAPGHDDAEWGRVLRWDRPVAVAFTWHPGSEPDRAGEVTVTFTTDGPLTRVRLVHTGWDQYPEPTAAREQYDAGWPVVLAPFEALVRARSTSSIMES